MNLENITIPIEPRTVGGCLDLAVQFNLSHVKQIGALVLLGAVPGTALTWYAATVTDNGLLWGLLIFFGLSPIVGALIVAGAGHRVFGDPFTVRGALASFWPHALRLTVLLLLYRIGTLLALVGLVTALLVAARGGNLPEAVLLEQLRGPRLRQRLGELNRGLHSSPVVNLITIWIFTLFAVFSLFIAVNVAADKLLGLSIWFGHDDGFLALLDRFTYDPAVVTLFTVTLWVLYPISRLAWFFCYLDQRIRNECWDVELDFRRELKRVTS